MSAMPLMVAVRDCGCLFEQPSRSVFSWIRCRSHWDRYVRAQILWTLRRCESCRRTRGLLRIEFGDGARWLVCGNCEPWRSRHVR